MEWLLLYKNNKAQAINYEPVSERRRRRRKEEEEEAEKQERPVE